MEDQIKKLQDEIAELKSKLQPTQEPTHNDTKNLNQEEMDEYSWEAPVRTFSKWDRKKVVNVFLWIAIISLVLIFLKEFVLLVTVILVTLVSVALVVIPPNKTTHKVTNKGINTYGRLYGWDELTSFWIAKKGEEFVMYVTTTLPFPNKLFIIIPHESLQQVINSMGKYLKYKDLKEQQGALGKISDGQYIKYNDLKQYFSSPSI